MLIIGRLAALTLGIGLLASAAWSQTADYLLGPQDTLTVTVFDNPHLSGRFTVEADGSFTFPLIGRVKATGLTPRALEGELVKRLQDGFLNNPQANVTVEQYRSQRVFIIGAVGTPGPLVLSGNTTLIEALARAGSPTSESVGDAILVRAKSGRPSVGPVMPDAAGDADVMRIDLSQIERGALTQNVVLRDGDTIVVPRGEPVFLLGQVRNPGSYAVRKGTTALQLLALGGGPTERGATNRIKVIRIVNGSRQELKLKADDIVQAGDTVVVPEKYF